MTPARRSRRVSPPPASTHHKARPQVEISHLVAAGVLLAAISLAYSNSFSTAMVLDNEQIIASDSRLRDLNRDNLRLIFTQDYWYGAGGVGGLFRPLTTLSYLINYSVLGSGAAPYGYHVVNFWLHYGNALLVYVLMLALLNWYWGAVAAAALFAVHPLGTEAVTNIIGRADLLAGMAVLGAVVCYMRGVSASGWRRVAWRAAAGGVALAGVFCKENAVVAIAVIPAYDLICRLAPRSHDARGVLEDAWVFFKRGWVALLPAAGAMWLVRQALYSGTILGIPVGQAMPPPLRPLTDNLLLSASVPVRTATGIKVLGMALWRMVWPSQLSADYSYNQIALVQPPYATWENAKFLVALAAIVAILLTAVFSRRRNRSLGFLVALFFITVLPTSNLVQPIGSIMAERFYYLPLVAFSGGVVIAVDALCGTLVRRLSFRSADAGALSRRVAAVVFTVAVAGYGLRSHVRNRDWENSLTLATSTVRSSPHSYRSHLQLALALAQQHANDDGLNRVIDRCIEEAETSARILEGLDVSSRDSLVYLVLGSALLVKGNMLSDVAPRGDLLAYAKSLLPNYRRALDALNAALEVETAAIDKRRQHEAEHLRAGAVLLAAPSARAADIYQRLSEVRQRLGDARGAVEASEQLRRLNPLRLQTYTELAGMYGATEQWDEAAVALIQILLLDQTRTDVYPRLDESYRHLGDHDAPVVPTETGPRLNVASPAVKRHLFLAHYGLVKLLADVRLYDAAVQFRNQAVQLGYSAEALDGILAGRGLAAESSRPKQP